MKRKIEKVDYTVDRNHKISKTIDDPYEALTKIFLDKKQELHDYYQRKIDALEAMQKQYYEEHTVTKKDDDVLLLETLPFDVQVHVLQFHEISFDRMYPKISTANLFERQTMLLRLLYGYNKRDQNRKIELVYSHYCLSSANSSIFYNDGIAAEETRILMTGAILKNLPQRTKSIRLESTEHDVDQVLRFKELESLSYDGVTIMPTDEEICKLKALTNLRTLKLRETPGVEAESLPLMNSFTKLRSLDLSAHEYYLPEDALHDMTLLPNLTYLNLQFTSVDNSCLHEAFEMKHIKHLNLLDTLVTWKIMPRSVLPPTLKVLQIPQFKVEYVKGYENDFSMTHQLEFIRVQHVKESHHCGWRYFLENGNLRKKIVKLISQKNNIVNLAAGMSPKMFEILADQTPFLDTVESLEMNGVDFTDLSLTSFLENTPSLRKLVLEDCKFNVEQIDALVKHPSLTNLNLFASPLTNDMIEKLFLTTKLKKLRIGPSLGHESMYMAGLNWSIESLTIMHCRTISDTTLAQIIRNNSSLTKLDLEGCLCREEFLQELSKHKSLTRVTISTPRELNMAIENVLNNSESILQMKLYDYESDDDDSDY